MSTRFVPDNTNYQALAMRTLGHLAGEQDQLNFAALEMASETGEVVNVVYKHLYQGHPLNVERLIEELGDVLWGVACMCDALKVSMTDVMEANIRKLEKRYPNGCFSAEDSIARRDHNED